MRKRCKALRWTCLALTMSCVFSGCSVARKKPLIPVAIIGVTLKDADLKATGQTRDLVERVLSTRREFLVKKDIGQKASYKSLDALIAAREFKLSSQDGMVIALSRERTAAADRILFHVFGGPAMAKYEMFSVDARDLDAGVHKVAELSSGYEHIIFDVSTLPPRTDIYVDDQPFQTTDDEGRFRQTFTWPAREYKIKFIAWIGGARREAEDKARVKAREVLHFRKYINLQHKK